MKKGLNMFIKRMICAAVIIAMLPAADLVSFAESGQITDGNGITYEYDTGTQTAYVASNNDVSGDVTIPSAVTVNGVDCTVIGIDDDAFCNCDSLTSVYIPASVAFIGDDAFCNCYSLTSVYIPASVTFIGSNAFAECTDLKSITVPDDNTSFSSVDGILFSKDRSTLICFPAGKIVDSYTVPDSVTVIDWNAFYGARISSVTIPSSVNIIFGYAFSDCSVLEYVSIADGLEIIGNCSFRYTRLTSITIPSSVNSIGDSAFEGSTGLNTVFFDGSKEKWAGVSKGRNWSQTTKLGSDPAVKEVTFKVVNGSWDDGTKEDKVVTVIGNSAKSLSGYGIPSAGKKPADESFTTGAWNADPSTAELTGDTTFTYTYSVPKTKLTITVKDQTHIYSGYQQGEGDPINTDPAVIETKIDVEGLLSGDSLSGIVLDGSASDAGEYPDALTASGAVIKDKNDNDNTGKYEITYVPGTLVINRREVTVTAEDADDAVYDSEEKTGSTKYSFSSIVKGHEAMIDYTPAKGTGVGRYTGSFKTGSFVVISEDGEEVTKNYDLKTATPGKLKIIPAEITVTVTGHNKTETYSGSEYSAEGYDLSCGDRLFDETLVRYDGNAVVKGTDADTYTMELDPADFSYDDKNVNVTWEVADGSLEITKAPADDLGLTAEGYEGEYDGKEHTVSAEVTAAGDTTFEYSTDGQNWSGEAPGIKDAGDLTVTVRASNPNYETAEAEVTLKVTRRAVTVTAENKTKRYNEKDPEFTAKTEGTLGSDTVAYKITRAEGDDVGKYEITPEGEAVQGNYDVTFVSGTLEIVRNSSELTDEQRPKAKTDLVEDGTDQELVTAPEERPDGYVVEYSTDGENWWSRIPTGREAGEYTVQVRYAGDENHDDIEGETLTVKIKALFTVIWLNGDGTELDSMTYAEGGDEPVTGKTPVKADDGANRYTFDRWDDGTEEGKTKTYSPVFTAVPKTEYTVIWLNGDGTELDRQTYTEGGTEPKTDRIPEKAEDGENTYTFSKWDKGTADGTTKTYSPVFKAEPKPAETEPEAPAPEEPVPVYTATVTNPKYAPGSMLDIVIRVTREPGNGECFLHFRGVELDGRGLERDKDYTAVEGSTVITVSAEVLETLPEGDHTVTVNFDDGSTETTLTVLTSGPVPGPETSDEPETLIWILPITVLAAAAFAASRRRA